MLPIKRYMIKNRALAEFAKFIWFLELDHAELRYKMLPTDCIDIVLNLSGEMWYELDSVKIKASDFHINGLRDRHSYIYHTGKIAVWGISFYAFGLYPLVRKSIKDTKNSIVNLFDFDASLAERLKTTLAGEHGSSKVAAGIERVLNAYLPNKDEWFQNVRLIDRYLQVASNTTVASFCREQNRSEKTFERMLLRYTGYTPKALAGRKRFQNTANEFVQGKDCSISDIVYKNAYADQSHFNREFLRFSGTTPIAFKRAKETIKENAIYQYE